jgi:glycosyltransferase involved in cell wall biosynthesis
MKFVIIDFCAKYQYTHHLPLIKKLSEIISEEYDPPIIFLSRYANRSAYKDVSGIKKFILTDVIYGPTLKENPFKRILIYLSSLVLKENDEKLAMKKFIKSILVHRVKRDLIRLHKSTNQEVTLVFPTSEPISIYLAESILKLPISRDFKFKFRLVGGENRGYLASKYELGNLAYLVQSFPNQIKIGYETNKYMQYLLSNGISPQNLVWSPWPPMPDFGINYLLEKEENTLGFFGNAKKRKGFDLIPNLMSTLEEKGYKFRVIIQPAIFEWKSYQYSLKKILEFPNSMVLLTEPELSLNQLLRYISQTNLLVLPYDRSSYSINASGIVYHGSDYHIPVITLEGVGFADEINEYGIGIVAKNIDDMVERIISIDKMVFNFENYNSARLKATKSFMLD